MRGGEMHSLGDLPGSTHPVGFDSGLASDINDLGQVVGQSDTPTGDHAFLWTSDEGMQDLNDLLDASGAGWRLLAAEGINNAGQIVGYGLSDAGAIRAFLLTPVTPATPTWKVDADGNWSEAANWTVGTPNAAGVQATLGAIITVPRAITLDSPTTIGSLDFISSATYTIAGANPLTFNSTEGQAKVMVVSGSHRVDAPVVLADNTLVDIAAADSSLSINGGITAIGATLTKTGPGMLTVNQLNIAAVVIDDGTLRLKSDGPPSQASVIGTLNIAGQAAPTARLDLNDALIIDYSGTSPAETIRQQILVGRGGTGLGKPWNGNGISSSAAAAANATEPESISVGYADNGTLPLGSYAMFRGQAVDATSLLVARTRTGDANLDGVVNDEDVTIISATYAPGVSQPSWSLGDFDYSGTVDDDDVTLLGAFYDPGAPPLSGEGGAAVAAIPEPRAALLALWGLAVTAIRYRCRCSIWRRGHA
jgi:probable HAF family extracellular repeat protein